MKNPNVSDEAKQHAKDVLDNELHGNESQQDLYDVRGRNKEPNRVAGGLKAYVFDFGYIADWQHMLTGEIRAQTNPRVKDRGRRSSAQKLEDMGQQPQE